MVLDRWTGALGESRPAVGQGSVAVPRLAGPGPKRGTRGAQLIFHGLFERVPYSSPAPEEVPPIAPLAANIIWVSAASAGTSSRGAGQSLATAIRMVTRMVPEHTDAPGHAGRTSKASAVSLLAASAARSRLSACESFAWRITVPQTAVVYREVI